MRKIAVFTATRAEYGLLYWLLKDIEEDKELKLQLLVSGSHLSPEFGLTYQQIERDGFKIDEKVEILLSSDSPIGVAKSMGLGVLGFADALNRLNPDVLVVLGDRFEVLAAAQTAMILRIPILHLHGGEITEGAYDDSIRHAVSKLSYFHATSTEEYRQRVIQLGEAPQRVRNVGAIGLDHLKRSEFMTRSALSDSLNFPLDSPYFVVTYHPVTLAKEAPEESFSAITSALDSYSNYKVVLTYPNADDGGRKIIPLLEEYAYKNTDRVLVVPSLGQTKYLSAIKYCSAVIGNSSSGIIEAPSFFKPTVNIGERQKGRLAASSIVHCKANSIAIVQAIRQALELLNSSKIRGIENPYGHGDSSQKVIEMLKKIPIDSVKKFFDISFKPFDVNEGRA